MYRFLGFSCLMFLVSICSFFILGGPNANLTLVISILGILSLLGIFFAIASKNWLFGIVDTVLNGLILVVVYFLLLAKGIGNIITFQ
ncbi:hypothetical protein BK720_04255 [Bacillus thuringiensis serovar brasilensis]|uniref:hypothetical protein n=1 Tax=Bacillus cereus group TaxID=86661 RepID=UPI000A392C30|nr:MULTISPECIES: hypothetical protein [Bacillus cereus group]MCU5029085.1 hypothetical protein [Bacillus cereus]MRA73248.1 hypothetical protein [Bacillus thuringiensis]MRA90105.1 hypothetical protein [Bacillus thuringiensis]MRC52656.1 hypothetical protein [Bacillus thuringiensis]OTX37507.1 hypothetical protein BK720_04255 [Bacillus thuringiensis serovar brasilensis]